MSRCVTKRRWCVTDVIRNAGVLLLFTTASGYLCAASIDAGQLERRFEEQPQALSTAQAIEVKESANQAPEGAESLLFRLTRLEIKGVTAIEQSEIEGLVTPLINQQVSLKQIYDLTNDLTQLYTQRGYLLSRAVLPAQTIEGGEVFIQVVEGYIDEVLIEGFEKNIPPQLNYFVQRIKATKPITQEVLERYLLLANQLPGFSFQSVLAPSKNNFGASSLTLTGYAEQSGFQYSLDNRGSNSSGPWQSLLEANRYSLLTPGDATRLRFATVPNDISELHYWSLNHQRPISPEGLTLNLDVSTTSSRPGGVTLNSLDVKSAGQSAGLSIFFPYLRTREENLSLTAGLTFKRSKTTQLDVATSDDSLSVLSLGITHDRADAHMGGGNTLLSASLRRGLNLLSPKVSSRAGASIDFTSLRLFAQRKQILNTQLSLTARTSMQLSDGSLPSSEQASLGGETSVRGYQPSEWSGDRSMTGTLELAYRPKLAWEGQVQLYGFYDLGKVWRDALLGEDSQNFAHSAGLGTRVFTVEGLALNLELSRPFKKDSTGKKLADQLYFRLSGRF